ncbi:MAG: diaminopimelate decarboxylase [Pyrinomonadaceae bacterium]
MTQPWQIENFLDIKNGHLHIDGVDAVDLAREHGTPLFVFSESRIRHNIDRLKKAADVIDCPLKLCYAAKAMSTMGILKVIKDAGCDIEVNSGGELWKALKAGFTGDQIIFNGTSKEVWEIEMAINADIYAIQVDSLYELSLIEQTAERLAKRANVSLRLVPEIESDTHSGLQTALLTSKFGMMPDEAFSAFREYKDSEHLALNGIHLHVGSQNPDPKVYTEALDKLIDCLSRIHKETGIALGHVNLGGGFPVNYLRDGAGDGSFGEEQTAMLSAHFPPSEALHSAWTAVKSGMSAETLQLLEGLNILLEPGRSIIADAGICITTVRNAKQRPTGDSQLTTDNWLLTDAGFNILLSMETYKWYYHLISAERADVAHDFRYKVAGPLCDGGDVYFDIEGEGRLPGHRILPPDAKPGEVLALLNCGAYSLAQASQYNGRFLPAVVLIRENGESQVIRRREDFEDLIRSDVLD